LNNFQTALVFVKYTSARPHTAAKKTAPSRMNEARLIQHTVLVGRR